MFTHHLNLPASINQARKILQYYDSPDCKDWRKSKMIKCIEGTADRGWHIVSVPDDVYISLHKAFDTNKQCVMTGKKDGTNRGPLKRLDNGNIISLDPRDSKDTHILPASVVFNDVDKTKVRSMSRYAQERQTISDDPFQAHLYQDEKFVGTGSLASNPLCQATKVRDLCEICAKPANEKCSRCLAAFYCSCQIQALIRNHKKTCLQFSVNSRMVIVL